MMRLAAVLLLAAACRSEAGPASVARVRVLAGNQPDPGVRVTAHAPDGEVIAEDDSDAVGIAELGVDADTLITVQFSGQRTTLVTTLAPVEDTTLEVHGPAREGSPLVVARVTVDAPLLAGAAYYEIDVGCVTVRRTQFPESIDVTACSTGNDRNVDVLVRAFHDVGAMKVFDGYAAARVPIIDGVALLQVATWETTGLELPVDVSDVDPELFYQFIIDGNRYDGLPVVDGKTLVYSGFASNVWHTHIRGVLDGGRRYTDEDGTGLTAGMFSANTFLPLLETGPTRVGQVLTWDPPTFAADVVALSATSSGISWDAILPPDTTTVTLPAIVSLDDTATITLRYLLDDYRNPDFRETQSDGVFADTIVPLEHSLPRRIVQTTRAP